MTKYRWEMGDIGAQSNNTVRSKLELPCKTWFDLDCVSFFVVDLPHHTIHA